VSDDQERLTFWLSFANKNTFGGVVIIDLYKDEIDVEGPFLAAIRKSIRLRINPGPGYSVQGQELPPDEIPEQFKHRLLGRAEADLLNLRPQ